jgi:hypothetical protein
MLKFSICCGIQNAFAIFSHVVFAKRESICMKCWVLKFIKAQISKVHLCQDFEIHQCLMVLKFIKG